MTVCALTTPPATLSLRMYALTRSSYCSSLSGRPRGEYGKTLSVFLLGLPWKSVWVLRIVLSVTSLPKSSLKWQAAFAGPFLIAERAIYGRDGFFHFSITQSRNLCFLNCMFSICVGSDMAGESVVDFPMSVVLPSLILASIYRIFITIACEQFELHSPIIIYGR